MSSGRTFTAGSRGSALARVQTELVTSALRAAHVDLSIDVLFIRTVGDRTLDVPLAALGGKGAFTAELEDALREGRIDFAVHSLKDLPVTMPAGVSVGAIVRRGEARDALVTRTGSATLMTIPHAARVGTSSLRRSVQLQMARPDLRIGDVRGNVDTRLAKLDAGEYDALVLAGAGLQRLGAGDRIDELIEAGVMLPAPGQGAIAVQCRADDDALLTLLQPLDDEATRAAVTAERAFLSALGGGCSAPIGAYAIVDASTGMLTMTGIIATPGGTHAIRVHGSDGNPLELAARMAEEALSAGAHELLGVP